MKNSEMPVDRGWAWVVCVACMVLTFVITGLFKSYGLFFVEFSSTFNVNASTVSLMLSIQSIAGSITAYLVLTVGELFFSNRTFIIFGAVVSSLSFILTSFAPTMSVVLFCQGVLFGFGIAFINGPAVVMIGQYFEKRRGFANSMLKVGGGVGSLILAPFYRFLLDYFGLRGTLMIVAGMILHIVPCGALLRPRKCYKTKTNNICNSEDEIKKELLPKQKLINSDNDTSKTITKDDDIVITIQNGTSITYSYEFPEKHIQVKPDHYMSYDRLFPKKDIVRLMRTFSEDPNNIHTNTSSENGSTEDLSIGTAVIKALSQSSVAIYGSVGQEYGSVGFIRTEKPTFMEMEIEEKTDTFCCCGNVTLSMLLSRILAFKLLKNKLFMLFVPSSMLSIIGFALIITYIPPHAKDVGIDATQTALLVSIISGSDLAGKFITAFISDSKHVKRHLIFVIPMLIVGTACQFIPLMTNFWSLAIFSAIYGFSGGFYFAILAVVVIDFVGVANLSSALGIMVLTHGIAKAATTPILGFLRDQTGSYVSGFHFLGACMLVGGIILLLEPLARKWEDKSKTTEPEGVCALSIDKPFITQKAD